MKIILLGSNGQLGSELKRQLPNSGDLFSFPRSSLDITNYNLVSDTINSINPDIIINAAAYTSVDKAEKDIDKSFMINSEAVDHLSKVVKEKNIYLIHYSTDYVFDGSKNIPYVETDIPINVYGASKLKGEKAIIEKNCKYLIFRTSWVIGKDGHNFAKSILKLASKQKKLSVINDQFGVPTSTSLISKVTLDAIKSIKNNTLWPQGIYHLTPKGTSNWHEIAQTVIRFAKKKSLNLTACLENILAIKTSDYPTTAKRPLNSQLNSNKLISQLSFDLPYWKDDFLETVSDIIDGIKKHKA